MSMPSSTTVTPSPRLSRRKTAVAAIKTNIEEFIASHHAKAGNILASLDNFGWPKPSKDPRNVKDEDGSFNPFILTAHARHDVDMVNGMASVDTGCKQCHGSKVALEAKDGTLITVDDLKPDADGKPTNFACRGTLVKHDASGRPVLHGQFVAQHGHRAFEPGWIARLLLGVPLAARFLAAPCSPAGKLRQMPLGS